MNRTQGQSLLQHELLCCRVCLMTDCRLYNIHEYKLANTFTRISGTPVSRDSLPQYLCAYCLVLLLKCSSFRDMCLHTQKRLTPLLLKGPLDTDYIRKYQLPHRSLNLTQTEVEIVELLPLGNLCNEQDEDIVLADGINEAYPVKESEIPEDLIEISDDDFEDEIVLKDGIITKRKSEKKRCKEKVLKTERNSKRQIETPVKNNMVPKIGRQLESNRSMSIDKSLIRLVKENTKTSQTPVKKNIVLKIGHVYNESMNIDQNLMKMGNTETMKMMTIEVKNDRIEFKVSDKSDDNDDLIHKEVGHEKIRNVKMNRRMVQNVKRRKRPKKVIKNIVTEQLPQFNFATMENTYNLKIVTLSKEEQLEEIATRKKSRNYLESPFKCEDCGKGFGVKSAYNNHRVWHSPSNGLHACEICAMRFRARSRLSQHQGCHRLKFICNECNFVSRIRPQAIKHHATHTGKTYECQHCGKSFIKCTTYFSHVRLLHPELNVDCVDCGETFVSDHGLWQHKKRIHDSKSKQFTCTICSIKFDSEKALKKHTELAGEHGEKLWPCEHCGENFDTEYAVKEHVELKHPTESHHCEVCDLAFANEAAFDTHNRRKHLGQRYAQPPGYYRNRFVKKKNKQKPYMCEQCGVIVRYPSMLVYHRRTHLAVKPFACPHCPKTFVMPYLLRWHMRSHTGEKPYQCDECPLAFSMKGNFTRHYDTAHRGIRGSFPCPVCGRASTTRGSMRLHLRAVHGDAGWPKRDRSKRKTNLLVDNK